MKELISIFASLISNFGLVMAIGSCHIKEHTGLFVDVKWQTNEKIMLLHRKFKNELVLMQCNIRGGDSDPEDDLDDDDDNSDDGDNESDAEEDEYEEEEYDDNYDDEDYEDENSSTVDVDKSQRQPQQRRINRQALPSQPRRGDYDPSRRYDSSSNRRRSPPQHRSRRGGNGALGTAANLAKKTVDLTTTAAVGTVKGSGKAAFYLVSPKHVNRKEVWGVWRLDQQVSRSYPDGPFVSCAANVEFTPPGDVITKYDDEVYRSPYLFREKSWPQSCSIEFEARAFQGPNDNKPVWMRYKGYFRRKIADRKVIKIIGKIYKVQQKKRGGLLGGRGPKRVQQVGTFVARRRLVAPPQPSSMSNGDSAEGIEDEDEYDDEDEYFDEDEYDDEDENNYDYEEDED